MITERQVTHNILTLDFGNYKPTLTLDKIHKALGYTKAPSPGMDEIIDSALNLTLELCDIKAGYGFFSGEYLSESSLKIGDLTIHPGVQIVPQLKHAEQLTFFIATIGRAIENWTNPLASAREPVLSYMIDTIGSLLAEEAAKILHHHLADKMKERDYAVSNRYSPGYCGWDVMEQKLLFQLMPKDFCGIRLGDSAFMEPRKSVSGIIGIGRNISWQRYNCKCCQNSLCHLITKKRSKIEHD